MTCEHSYVSGVCSVCGAEEPNRDFYLFGYINGSDYACESDYANMGEYKFTDGQLVATFEQDSYVGVKSANNQEWYMTAGWLGKDVNTAVLYNTNTLSNADKLFVPGGVEITFTLSDNGDGTLTLSYTEGEPAVEAPTVSLKYPSVVFEDEIVMNIYYTVSDVTSIAEMGLITYSSSVSEWNVDTAEAVISGYQYSEKDGCYYVTTSGIPAKNLGDKIYFSVYTLLTDGRYLYTNLIGYSPSTYAYNLLNSASSGSDMKSLVVAMLNYGAAAQTYFGYNTDSLVNAKLTTEQKTLVAEYSSSMVAGVVAVDSSKVGSFVNSGGFTRRYPSISFEGAFSINYYFVPSNTPSGSIIMYYWNQEDYNNATILRSTNATGKVVMSDPTEYCAAVENIAAKNLDGTIYVCAGYVSNGTTYCTGVLAYSIGSYCVSQAAGSTSMKPFAAATAVYGYYAKNYFLNN